MAVSLLHTFQLAAVGCLQIACYKSVRDSYVAPLLPSCLPVFQAAITEPSNAASAALHAEVCVTTSDMRAVFCCRVQAVAAYATQLKVPLEIADTDARQGYWKLFFGKLVNYHVLLRR
jgi:hypothetical protein